MLIGVDGATLASATNPVPVTLEASGGASHVIVDSGTLTAVTAITNALPAGQNAIGNVGGKTTTVTVTPTVTATNSYGANYVVGGLLTFANMFTSTGSGVIQSAWVTCKKIETSGFTLFIFNANPSNTTWTDASVAAINAADVGKVVAAIPLSSSNALGTDTTAYAYGLGLAVNVAATSLYAVLLSNATLTNQFASTSDVTVSISVLADA
jgi:hypothetical protein